MPAIGAKRTFADPAWRTLAVGPRSNSLSCVHGAYYPGCGHRFPLPPRQFAALSGPQSFHSKDCGPFVFLDRGHHAPSAKRTFRFGSVGRSPN
jgi:hypothetical protein